VEGHSSENLMSQEEKDKKYCVDKHIEQLQLDYANKSQESSLILPHLGQDLHNTLLRDQDLNKPSSKNPPQ
jgi:hypothetical protein